MEGLITVRESKKRVMELRKDRKFGGKGGGRGSGSSSSSGKKFMSSFGKGSKGQDKKNSDCHACGEKGHWAGDTSCPKLKEWKAEQAKNKLQQRTKPRESLVVDLLNAEEVRAAQEATSKDVFEALVIESDLRHDDGFATADGPAVGVARRPRPSRGDVPPLLTGPMAWCKFCMYLGDYRDIRCSLCGRDYLEMVTATDGRFPLGHLGVRAWCEDCKLIGDDRDFRCSMRGHEYLDICSEDAARGENRGDEPGARVRGAGGHERADRRYRSSGGAALLGVGRRSRRRRDAGLGVQQHRLRRRLRRQD